MTALNHDASAFKADADAVSLFQALGGGWWNRPGPGVRRAAPTSASNRQ